MIWIKLMLGLSGRRLSRMVTMMLTDGWLIVAWKLVMVGWWQSKGRLNGELPHNLASNYPTMLMLCPTPPPGFCC